MDNLHENKIEAISWIASFYKERFGPKSKYTKGVNNITIWKKLIRLFITIIKRVIVPHIVYLDTNYYGLKQRNDKIILAKKTYYEYS